MTRSLKYSHFLCTAAMRFRVLGFGFRVSGFGFSVFGCRDEGFRVQDLGLRVGHQKAHVQPLAVHHSNPPLPRREIDRQRADQVEHAVRDVYHVRDLRVLSVSSVW